MGDSMICTMGKKVKEMWYCMEKSLDGKLGVGIN
jgi:hypothetical protein